MQDLSLLQLLKIFSAAAPAAPSEPPAASDSPSVSMPKNDTMPENNTSSPKEQSPAGSVPLPDEATPDFPVRAYENFLARHEQAMRRAQKNK